MNSAKPVLVLLPGLNETGRLYTSLFRELPDGIETIFPHIQLTLR